MWKIFKKKIFYKYIIIIIRSKKINLCRHHDVFLGKYAQSWCTPAIAIKIIGSEYKGGSVSGRCKEGISHKSHGEASESPIEGISPGERTQPWTPLPATVFTYLSFKLI